MKFNAIVGNPPYQKSIGNTGGNKAKSKAIYHIFIDISIKISKRYTSLITPSRWLTLSTEGISAEFVKKMITSNKELFIKDYEDSRNIFPNVNVKGGISYFLTDNQYNGKCQYIYVDSKNIVTKKNRFLKEENLDFVIRRNIDIDIVHKIKEKTQDIATSNFATIVSPKDFFTTKTSLTSSWNGFSKEKTEDYNIKLYVNKSIHKVDCGFIRLEDIEKNSEFRYGYKVYIPSASGTGNDNMILGKAFVGDKDSVCSQTYLVIGYNCNKGTLTKKECERIVKYIHTKFFRYMVSIKKKTQNGSRRVYQLVPMQDFTNRSDIDWDKSVSEIDQQLYRKYGLSEEEKKHIELSIKEMKV